MSKRKKFVPMSIGARITELREKKRLNMNQLAKAVELSPVQIKNYETDAQVPTVTKVQAIANALDSSVSYIIEGDDLSAVERWIPRIRRLPKSVQDDIIKFIKVQIIATSSDELKNQLLEEL